MTFTTKKSNVLHSSRANHHDVKGTGAKWLWKADCELVNFSTRFECSDFHVQWSTSHLQSNGSTCAALASGHPVRPVSEGAWHWTSVLVRLRNRRHLTTRQTTRCVPADVPVTFRTCVTFDHEWFHQIHENYYFPLNGAALELSHEITRPLSPLEIITAHITKAGTKKVLHFTLFLNGWHS